jgi:hypothetical protein
VLAVPGKTVANTRKETGAVRRLIYAMAFLLLIGLVAAGVFTHSRPPGAKALLTRAAQAMEKAQSVHVVLHRTDMPWPDSPVGIRMSPDRADQWVGPEVEAFTAVSPEGAITMSMGLNLGTGEVWSGSEAGNIYVANLRPLGTKGEEIGRKEVRESLALFAEGLLGRGAKFIHLKNLTESVTTETRDGRRVNVVTYAGDTPVVSGGQLVKERYVFDLDARSGRLLAYRRYASVPGVKEELVGGIEMIEYDVPVPTTPRPQVGTVLPATLRIEETADTLKLIMSAGDKYIMTIEVPK